MSSSTRRLVFCLLVLATMVVAMVGVRWHGQHAIAVPEWPLALDLFLGLPPAYLLLMRPGKRQAVIGTTALVSLGIAFGAWVLPDSDKAVWPWLEQLRWAGLAALLAWQALALVQIVHILWKAPQGVPLETCLHQALDQRFGPGITTELLKLEARVWLYVLCRAGHRLAFPKRAAFSVHRQGGNASNQLGFLLIGAVEMPIVHVLLHLYSPTAALVVSSLTVYGLAFLYADYRATLLRPITIGAEHVRLRYGVLTDLTIPRQAIINATPINQHPRRAPRALRCFGMGKVNLVLELAEGTHLNTAFGSREINKVYLGVDEPERFIEVLTR